MGRFGSSVLCTVAVVIAALGTTGVPATADPGIGAAGPWRVLPGAFPVRSDWLAGPRVVLPDPNGCFVAFGQDSTGYGTVPGSWQATADDCTAPVRLGSPPGRPPGDGLPSYDRASVIAATPAHGGGYLLLSRYTYEGDAFAYRTDVLRVDPTGDWSRVGEFATSTPSESRVGPESLVTVDGGYVAVGHRNGVALAWTSPDGRQWSAVELPVPAGTATSDLRVTVGPHGRLVALGTAGGALIGWRSTDAGRTWQTARMPAVTGTPQVSTIVHSAGRYLAFGGTDGGVRGKALVLVSRDGRRWRVDPTATAAGVRSVAAAVAMPGRTVLAVTSAGNATEAGECALAWRATRAGWTSEDLGCSGVPTSLAVLADGTVAGVHWSTLYLRSPGAPTGS